MANYTPKNAWLDQILSIDDDSPLIGEDGGPPPDEIQTRQLADNIRWLRTYVETTYGTSLPTADALIRRDTAGRARVAAPQNGQDIARLQDVVDAAGTLAQQVSNQGTAIDQSLNQAINDLNVAITQAKTAAINAAGGALGDHAGAADPHSQYLLKTAHTAHLNAADPHTQYLNQARGDARYLDTLVGPVAFRPGWGIYAAGEWGPVQAEKNAAGLVMLSGLFDANPGNTVTVGYVEIGVLPVGFRPANGVIDAIQHYDATLGDVTARVNIYSTGVIQVSSPGIHWNSLNGIAFYAA